MTLYFVSDTGAAKYSGPDVETIRRATTAMGYRECSHEEWQKKRRWQRRQKLNASKNAV